MRKLINSNIILAAKVLAQNAIGLPGSIREVLRCNPQLACLDLAPSHSASMATSVLWGQMGDHLLFGPGHVAFQTRRDAGGTYVGRVEALGNLAMPDLAVDDWSCDIGEIAALSASKSPLAECATLDDFARTYAADKLSDVAAVVGAHGSRAESARAQIDELLLSRPFGIFKPAAAKDASETLVINAWESPLRICYDNSDGSHRFAAARLIAREASLDYNVTAKLKIRRLNLGAVQQLANEFSVMALPPANLFFERGTTDTRELMDAIEAFGATYGQVELPPGPNGIPLGEAILLPHNDPRSAAVARAMRDAGITDVVMHLRQLCVMQPSDDAIVKMGRGRVVVPRAGVTDDTSKRPGGMRP